MLIQIEVPQIAVRDFTEYFTRVFGREPTTEEMTEFFVADIPGFYAEAGVTDLEETILDSFDHLRD